LNAQYRKFIDAGGYTNQVYWDARGWAKWNEPKYWDDSRYDGTDQPVVGISWYETQAYANWLSTETGLDFGLPTEAQWEKAARGTDGRIYPWGNKWDESKANGWGSNDDYRYTAPVGSYPKGASPYSIVGMSGNVREWTLDWYANDYYKKTPSRNPQGPASGERRVLRGGSWLDNPNYFRTTFRVGFNPAHRDIAVGFRLVRHDKEE